jgi:Flp pilus assembly protein TadG
MRHRIREFAGDKGQAIAEFTIILPLAALLLFGVVDLGRAFAYWLDSGHLANEAARYAVVDQCPQNVPALPATCASQPDGTMSDPSQLPGAILAQVETKELRSLATVCIQDLTPPGTAWAAGDTLKVTVHSDFPFVPIVSSATKRLTLPVNGTSTMRIERTWTIKPTGAGGTTDKIGSC